MNRSHKTKLVKKYGTNVTVRRFLGDVVIKEEPTKMLLGRATRTNTNLKTSEHQRTGIFLPEFDVDIGDFVYNSNHKEVYVVVTTHSEYDGDRTLSIVSNLFTCDHQLTVKGNIRVVDERYNVKSVFGSKFENVPCYLERITSELRQYDPGINHDTEHRIYTTALEGIELTDQIIVTMDGHSQQFKVVDLDYTTYPKLVVIEVANDLRK